VIDAQAVLSALAVVLALFAGIAGLVLLCVWLLWWVFGSDGD